MNIVDELINTRVNLYCNNVAYQQLLSPEIKADYKKLIEKQENRLDELKKEIESAVDFKTRWEQDKLYKSEQFNLCNPEQDSYCMFEAQIDDYLEKIEKIKEILHDNRGLKGVDSRDLAAKIERIL